MSTVFCIANKNTKFIYIYIYIYIYILYIHIYITKPSPLITTPWWITRSWPPAAQMQISDRRKQQPLMTRLTSSTSLHAPCSPLVSYSWSMCEPRWLIETQQSSQNKVTQRIHMLQDCRRILSKSLHTFIEDKVLRPP